MGFGKRRNLTAIMAVLALTASVFAASSVSASSHCSPAGDTGQTALYVNESVKGEVINLDDEGCDIAIYFDENAPRKASVRDTRVIMESGSGGERTGVWNSGASVDVQGSSFHTDFAGQFVPIRYDNGASGRIANNELTGSHRSGILVRGDGTDVNINGNLVAGTGAKTSGWAENGIQVDQGATADIIGNTVEGHWWDGESNFASSGIMSFTSDSRITNNTLSDNEFSMYVAGDGNRVTGNRVDSTIESQSTLEFQAYGVLLAGDENHLAGNRFSSEDGAVGIYVFPGSDSTRMNGNRISGFDFPIFDGGDNTKARGNPLVTGEGIDVYAHPVH